MKNNIKPWYDMSKKESMLNHSKGWDCPTCGINLPSGIVGISNHWAECGGRELHKKIVSIFNDKDSEFKYLKKVLDDEFLKTNDVEIQYPDPLTNREKELMFDCKIEELTKEEIKTKYPNIYKKLFSDE